MKEKLNLTIEKEVKDRAKRLARKKGISVSQMVEQVLKSISQPSENWGARKGSVVSKMSGSIPVADNIEYDEILAEALMEKGGYGKNID